MSSNAGNEASLIRNFKKLPLRRIEKANEGRTKSKANYKKPSSPPNGIRRVERPRRRPATRTLHFRDCLRMTTIREKNVSI